MYFSLLAYAAQPGVRTIGSESIDIGCDVKQDCPARQNGRVGGREAFWQHNAHTMGSEQIYVVRTSQQACPALTSLWGAAGRIPPFTQWNWKVFP